MTYATAGATTVATTIAPVMVQLSITPTTRMSQAQKTTIKIPVNSQSRRVTDSQTGRSPAGINPLGVVPTPIPAAPTSTEFSWVRVGKKLAMVGPPRKRPVTAAAPRDVIPVTTITRRTDRPEKNW